MNVITQVAHALTARDGAYAVLLGSGISRVAGVPTGWEVTLELVRSLAKAEGHDPGEDPVAWYQQKHDEPPAYDALLERLYPSLEDRQGALKRFFSRAQSEEDPTKLKPTRAHRAVARLMASGTIQVVVTTNFDRLLEDALAELNIHASVLATPMQVRGALPLQHAGPTILKIHGDYVDARLRNTSTELSHYEDAENNLLDRIFDEYGLIVLGWSGDWDPALKDAICNSPTQRFTTFFTVFQGRPSLAAADIIRRRSAVQVDITSADDFLESVADAVIAVRDSRLADPRDARLLSARVRQLVDGRRYSSLFDLIMGEAERVRESLDTFPMGRDAPRPDLSERTRRLQQYDAFMAPLDALLANGVFFDSREFDDDVKSPYTRALALLGVRPPTGGGGFRPLYVREDVPPSEEFWPLFRLYPAVRTLYITGVAAIAAGRYNLLGEIFGCKIALPMGDEPAVIALNPITFMPNNLFPYWAPINPVGIHLKESMWTLAFKELLRDKHAYREVFDRFELLATIADQKLNDVGRFRWIPTDFLALSQARSTALLQLSKEAFKEQPAPWQAALHKNALVTDFEKFQKDLPGLLARAE